MFQGMSEENLKRRVLDQSAKNKKAMDDWMFAPGSTALGLGAIVVLLGIWTVVRFFWSR